MKKSKTKPVQTKAQPAQPMGITLVLNPGEVIRVTVAKTNGAICGTILGTLFVETNGVEYRWPNCKKSTGRKLTWVTLTRLMQSGLI